MPDMTRMNNIENTMAHYYFLVSRRLADNFCEFVHCLDFMSVALS